MSGQKSLSEVKVAKIKHSIATIKRILEDSNLMSTKKLPPDYFEKFDTRNMEATFREIVTTLKNEGLPKISNEFDVIMRTFLSFRKDSSLIDSKTKVTLFRITATAQIFKNNLRKRTYLNALKLKEETLQLGNSKKNNQFGRKKSLNWVHRYSSEGYCVRCKAKRVIKNEKQISMKNGKPASLGTCAVCGNKMFKIGGGPSKAVKKSRTKPKPKAESINIDNIGGSVNDINPGGLGTPRGDYLAGYQVTGRGSGVNYESVDHQHRGQRGINLKRPEHTEMSKIERYPEASFPDTVQISRVEKLTVKIVTTRQNQSAPKLIMGARPGAKKVVVQVSLSTDSHFKSIDNKYNDIIKVPTAKEESKPITFYLEALQEGKSDIRLQFWQNGSYLGQMYIMTTVSSAESKPRESLLPKASITHRGDGYALSDISPAADLNIIVEHPSHTPEDYYRIGIMPKDGNTEFLDVVPSNLVFKSEDDLNSLISGLNDETLLPDQIRRRMINAGRALYTSLFPENSKLRARFVEKARKGMTSVLVFSDEKFIPWEIVRPHGDGLEEGYLCELYSFVRWRKSNNSTSLSPIKIANIVYSNSNLEAAVLEKEALVEFLRNSGIEPTIISKASIAINVIESGKYDLIHFGSHGNFRNKGGVSIPLDDGKSIAPDDILTPDEKKYGGHPFVFMNACSTGREIVRFNRMNGWISKFIANGAKVFIGTLWPIEQTRAKDFAEALYNNLKKGLDIGEAVKRARDTSQRQGDISHLAYVLYTSNPHNRISFKK